MLGSYPTQAAQNHIRVSPGPPRGSRAISQPPRLCSGGRRRHAGRRPEPPSRGPGAGWRGELAGSSGSLVSRLPSPVSHSAQGNHYADCPLSWAKRKASLREQVRRLFARPREAGSGTEHGCGAESCQVGRQFAFCPVMADLGMPGSGEKRCDPVRQPGGRNSLFMMGLWLPLGMRKATTEGHRKRQGKRGPLFLLGTVSRPGLP